MATKPSSGGRSRSGSGEISRRDRKSQTPAIFEKFVSDEAITFRGDRKHDNMIDRPRNISVVHIVDKSAMQRSLISKVLAAEAIETTCHEHWNDIHKVYSPDRSGCLVLEYSLVDQQQTQAVGGSQSMSTLVLDDGSEISLPTVFIAEQPTVSEAVTAMRFGAIDFLEKPICPRALCQAVRMAISKGHQLHEQRVRDEGLKARTARLTKREQETMALVLEGLSIKQIAAAFGIGLQTAAKHRARLLAKMNVRSDAQLVQLVYSQEWNAV